MKASDVQLCQPGTRHLIVMLLLPVAVLCIGCVLGEDRRREPPVLPDFRVASLEWGPAFCVSAVIRNMGSGPKPAGVRLSYRLEATYRDPDRSRTLSGVDQFLSHRELPVGWEAPLWVCDLSGDAINAYRRGRVRFTVNTDTAVAEASKTNNSRDINIPSWSGSDVQIVGGMVVPIEDHPSQPVTARVRIKNIGNQAASGEFPLVMIVQARGPFPQPLRYEIPSTVNLTLKPEEERTIEVPLSPPLPSVGHVPPGFFSCVWVLAQFTHTGYAVYLAPPHYRGRLAPGGPPLPQQDTTSDHCWTTVNTHVVPAP